MSDELRLSADFPEANEADWLALVDKALKGKSVDTLSSKTEHGLPIKGLYRESDWAASIDPSGLPGFAPHTRGARPDKDAFLPWDIRPIIAHPNPTIAKTRLMEALENGASSVELRIDTSGELGVALVSSAEVASILSEVRLDLATLALDALGESANSAIEVAAIVAAAIPKEARSSARIAFNVDPIGTFVRTGELPNAAMQEATAFAKHVSSEWSASTAIRVDARPIHEAGGTEVQELAFMAASGAAYLRELIAGGLSPDEACRSLLFTLATGPDYQIEMAKLRAARRIWARIADAFGTSSDAPSMQIQAVTSRRMLACRDPWVNILRNTAACFAAGVGGADIVTVRNFTDAMGLPSSLARRLARNTQIIAQEECNLGKVIDPPGGAWALEKLGEDIAQAAWSLFQSIETEGGIQDALVAGKFQDGVREAAAARMSAVARRKEWITGVSDFALIGEELPDVEKVDMGAIHAARPKPTNEQPSSREFTDIMDAARTASTLPDLVVEAPVAAECSPLWPMRVSEPFERLRDVADRRRAAGKTPKIFLAALGPLAEHSARLMYAQNFFAAAGIEAVPAAGDKDELVQAFKSSGTLLCCICGSDKRYQLEAGPTADALKQAGAVRIYMAGKPGDAEQELRDAGVAEFIYIGVDILASLGLAHAELGIGA